MNCEVCGAEMERGGTEARPQYFCRGEWRELVHGFEGPHRKALRRRGLL